MLKSVQKLTDDQIVEMRHARIDETPAPTLAELAARYKVSSSTVSRWLGTQNVRRHGASAYNMGCRCEICLDGFHRKNRASKDWKNARSLKEATNARKPWTSKERSLALRPDLSTTQVAKMLGRSYYAVNRARSRARDLARK